MNRSSQKRWAIWAVWIGLVPVCLMAILASIGMAMEPSISYGSAPIVFAILVFPFVYLFSVQRLYKRVETWVSKGAIALHSFFLVVGLGICVFTSVTGISIVRSAPALAGNVMITFGPIFFSLAFFWTAWIGHLVIFIDRVRRRKRTEEVFT